MNSAEILEVALKCSNALIVVFSETERISAQLHESFVRLAPKAEVYWSLRKIRFCNGSQIRFSHSLGSTPYGGNDDICGLEIALAVMNDVEPTIYLRTRVRVGRCDNYERFGLPKIVEYEPLTPPPPPSSI